jgi:hypothetical protein
MSEKNTAAVNRKIRNRPLAFTENISVVIAKIQNPRLLVPEVIEAATASPQNTTAMNSKVWCLQKLCEEAALGLIFVLLL